jgi:hypothetical protein
LGIATAGSSWPLAPEDVELEEVGVVLDAVEAPHAGPSASAKTVTSPRATRPAGFI